MVQSGGDQDRGLYLRKNLNLDQKKQGVALTAGVDFLSNQHNI